MADVAAASLCAKWAPCVDYHGSTLNSLRTKAAWIGRSSASRLLVGKHRTLWTGRPSFRSIYPVTRAARDASFSGGSNDPAGPAPEFPRINVWDPYKRLGISKEASEEEIQEARNYLLRQYGGHDKSKAAIESAYDKIIIESLKQRRWAKATVKVRKEPPAWLQAISKRIDVPPTSAIVARAFVFVVLGLWSVLEKNPGGPAFQVIVSLAACIYFLNKTFKILWKSSLIGTASFIVAWIVGSFLVPAMPDALFPGSWNIELMTSLVSYVILWLSCTFLK